MADDVASIELLRALPRAADDPAERKIHVAPFDAMPLLLGAFLVCLIGAAIVFQARSDMPPSAERSPIEFFTAALLWQLSLVALLIAGRHRFLSLGFVGWMAASAALGGLAIDEIFAFHERTSAVAGNDDYIKVVLWLGSGFVLAVAARSARLAHPYATVLALGYVLQTAYILVELGDGDVFRLPFLSEAALAWAEELLELLFLAAYAFGLAGAVRPASPARAG